MPIETHDILKQKAFSKHDIIQLISSTDANHRALMEKAERILTKNIGNTVYFRGLIELSNICTQNCLYCGIRKGNYNLNRYLLNDDQVEETVRWADSQGFGSIVLQSGQRNDPQFIHRIEYLLIKIKQITQNRLGITLSLGEQSKETYRRWFEAGAHRYLLRIETTNALLFKKIHADDQDYQKRLKSLYHLQEIGYQTGMGVMIGLPGQSYSDLADDLLFFQKMDIDMVGMGPFIIHSQTPLNTDKDNLWSEQRRLEVTLNMIATLRLLMPDINIAAATALDAIDEKGRERALLAGANIIMPNITPQAYQNDYSLYNGKPCTDEETTKTIKQLTDNIESLNKTVGRNLWGDSLHFKNRQHPKQNWDKTV